VRATTRADFRDDISALMPPAECKHTVASDDKDATITNGKIQVTVDADGRITFRKADGTTLLQESAFFHLCSIRPHNREYENLGGDLDEISIRFAGQEDERFYGMGQRTHGMLNQKGCVLELAQRNTQVSIPFLVSSRGYGFIWNTPAYGRVELARNNTTWVAQGARQVDYVVIAGDSYREILSLYTALTGRSPMIPDWATGFWQCKLRYKTQDEVMEVARKHKRLGLPISVIVIDFFHWTAIGEWTFDKEAWPDPDAMVSELKEMGIKLMVSVWPGVHSWAKTFEEMRDADMLVKTDAGTYGLLPIDDSHQRQMASMAYYDSTNPAARDYVWNKIKEGYLKHDIDAYWLDACEPDMWPFQPRHVKYHMGAATEVGAMYPLLHQKMVYEGLQAEECDDVLTLCRSGWLGSQRYAAAVWNGDIQSTWENLQMSIRAGLNALMSGIAWWTTDIGGFHSGDSKDEAFHELLVRWFEYGLFCPLFRLHGVRKPLSGDKPLNGASNEVWSYGPEVYQKVAPLLFLRERLRPYITEQMQLTHTAGVPSMRPVFFDFESDPRCQTIEDQFMFGPSIMVAPIEKAGVNSREVYLPATSKWTHAWTGKQYEGGQSITVPAPMGQGPVFIRDSQLDVKLFANLPCPPMGQ